MSKVPVGLACAAVILMVGCEKPNPDLYKIQMGMTEKDVMRKLGKPDSVSMQGNYKYLEYESYEYNQWTGVKENIRYFFVRINDGRVDLFGRKGDFNTTQHPERTVNVNQNIHETGADQSPFDLDSELRKIDRLKKDGLIDESQHKQLREQALKRAGIKVP